MRGMRMGSWGCDGQATENWSNAAASDKPSAGSGRQSYLAIQRRSGVGWILGSELLLLPGLAKAVVEVSDELVLQHIAYQLLAVALAQLLSS